jgi:hypothetical protein
VGLFDFIKRLIERILEWLRRLFGGSSGCEPEAPPEGCPIGWQPSVLTPVFYGARDVGLADDDPRDAPGLCRIFFPSLDGAVFDAPLLEGCGAYPLVIFCHGQCELDTEHYKKWYEIPAALARSGYVVLVPALSGAAPSEADEDLALLGDLETWVRSTWEHRSVLAPQTGVIGHSRGGGLGARYAENASISAYASLSGQGISPAFELRMPKLFTWGEATIDPFAAIVDSTWSSIPPDRHRVAFTGSGHFDYLPAGRSECESKLGRGPCNLVPTLTADIVATFFGKYMPPERWAVLGTCIPDTLIAPSYDLSTEQRFFAGGHQMGFELLAGSDTCELELAWTTAAGSGSLSKP